MNTFQTITRAMTSAGWNFQSIQAQETIISGFETQNYRDNEGDPHLPVHIVVQENGEFVTFLVPNAYRCPSDHPHLAAVLQTCMTLDYAQKMLRYQYDPSDGEIRATVDMPLEDSKFTERQFRRALDGLVSLVDRNHSAIEAALEGGRTPDSTLSTGGVGEAVNLLTGLAALAALADVVKRAASDDSAELPIPATARSVSPDLN